MVQSVDQTARDMARSAQETIDKHDAVCGMRYVAIFQGQERMETEISLLHTRVSKAKSSIIRAIILALATMVGTLAGALGTAAVVMYDKL